MTDQRKQKAVQQSSGKQLLEKAYLLETPDDSVSYYNELADSYDKDFSEGLGYALPQAVASQFHAMARSVDTPVVDVGCGTGLLGRALNVPGIALDGFDISSAMLSQSKKTTLYRDLHEVDLTKKISGFTNYYGAVLSSGTFTHGHLGPDALVQLLSIARSGALFVVAINQRHFDKKEFAESLTGLESDDLIVAQQRHAVDIYSQAGHAHSSDKGLLLSFRKS